MAESVSMLWVRLGSQGNRRRYAIGYVDLAATIAANCYWLAPRAASTLHITINHHEPQAHSNQPLPATNYLLLATRRPKLRLGLRFALITGRPLCSIIRPLGFRR